MSELENFAKEELERIGLMTGNNGAADSIFKLITLYARSRSHIFDYDFVLEAFYKLAKNIPISAVTGEESEWQYIGSGWQNARDKSIFEDAHGRAYRVDAILFRDHSGTISSKRQSHVFIDFPYYHVDPVIVDVAEDGSFEIPEEFIGKLRNP